MEKFSSQRDAKEYLVRQIAAEAEREGNPLSEVERKMLYFSETDWTLPEIMEVNREFERSCDEEDYEQRVCSLGQSIEKRISDAGTAERDSWYAALLKLSEGDHYLLTLLDSKVR
jgi:hypothetical protein